MEICSTNAKEPMPRRTPEQQLAELEKKENQLKARIQKKKAEVKGKERKRDTRMKIIAGALALEQMSHDAAFAKTMKRLLREKIKRQEDRAMFDL